MIYPKFSCLLAVGLFFFQLFGLVIAENGTEEQLRNRNRTVSIGIVSLFYESKKSTR